MDNKHNKQIAQIFLGEISMSTNPVKQQQTNSGMSLLRFVNCKEEQQEPTRPWIEGKDPPWSKLYHGLNLKGKCPSKNNNCSGKPVWVPLGYSPDNANFSMNRECAKARCIGCKTLLDEVVNVNLINCRVKLSGMDASNNEILEEKTTSKENSSLSFQEDKGENITSWKFLEMKVTKIPKTAESHEGIPFFKWIFSFFN